MFANFFYTILYFAGVTRFIGWLNRDQVMVLCYHSVSPQPELVSHHPWKMYLDRRLFEMQLNYLQKNCRVISLREFLEARRENRPLPPNSVVLTFDDGKRNFLTVVKPCLAAHSFPATVFIVINHTDERCGETAESLPPATAEWTPGDDWQHLSWREIEILMNEPGIEIGSHTCSHPRLNEISLAKAERELRNSRQKIADFTGNNSVSLSYPHGKASDKIAKLAASVGYSCGLTGKGGGNGAKPDFFLMNRVVILSDESMPVFAARVAGLTGWIDALRATLSPFGRKVKNLKKLKLEETSNAPAVRFSSTKD